MDGWSEVYRGKERVNRRRFLLTGLLAALAGGAGWAARRAAREDWPEVILPPKLLPAGMAGGLDSSAEPAADAAALAELSAARAEITRLQRELSSARAEAESLRSRAVGAESEVAGLNAGLDQARGRLGALAGLVALYHRLEALELDELAEAGLSSVAAQTAHTLAQLPAVRDGLQVAEAALRRLEQAVPMIRAGTEWLAGLTGRLADSLQVLENSVARTVAPLEPLADRLAAFGERILGWVPFGWGDRIELGLASIAGVLAHVPELVRGTGPVLLGPLQHWMGDDREAGAIQEDLIGPVRGRALHPARLMADEVERLDGRLREGLSLPLRSRLVERRPLRREIASYREQHGL